MALRDKFQEILAGYLAAKASPLTGHPMGNLVRQEVSAEVQRISSLVAESFLVKGSVGAGQWTEIPWVAVLDGEVTDAPTYGYYPVYLFDPRRGSVHLSLNQGAWSVNDEFKKGAPAVLAKRAEIIRGRVRDFQTRFPTHEIDLSGYRNGRLYASGHALGVSYSAGALPDDRELEDDLIGMLACYQALTFRGGLDTGRESDTDDPSGGSVDETRRYRMHRRIERNPDAAKRAKSHHGYVCQVCDFDFQERYGDVGHEFIEVHHLTPISKLGEGVRVAYNVARDFAVLCPNCHRMIHRMEDPGDLAALRAELR